MGKRNLYIAIFIVLVVVVVVLLGNYGNISGRLGSVYRTCEDSEEDINYYEKGTITYTVYGKKSEYTDYCFGKTATPEKWLKEYYCTVHERVDTIDDYLCPQGCEDGACIELKSECLDSDGVNYYVKGEACVDSDCKEDLCIDEEHLSEAYCNEEGEMAAQIFKCPDECLKGHGICSA